MQRHKQLNFVLGLYTREIIVLDNAEYTYKRDNFTWSRCVWI